jgi:hypothetical protein
MAVDTTQTVSYEVLVKLGVQARYANTSAQDAYAMEDALHGIIESFRPAGLTDAENDEWMRRFGDDVSAALEAEEA